jgi:hypothetical protein
MRLYPFAKVIDVWRRWEVFRLDLPAEGLRQRIYMRDKTVP